MGFTRAFRPYSVAQTAQPVFGSALSAAIRGNGLTAQQVTVGDTSMFLNNDTVYMFPAVGGKPTEGAIQIQVVNSTTVSGIFAKNHAAGEFMVLSYPCSNVQIQGTAANPLTASLFLGGPNPVPTTAGVNAFYDVFLSLYYAGPPGITPSDNTSNYWAISASGTQYYLPSAVQSG